MKLFVSLIALSFAACATEEKTVTYKDRPPQTETTTRLATKEEVNMNADRAVENTKSLGQRIGDKTREAAQNAAAGVKRGVRSATTPAKDPDASDEISETREVTAADGKRYLETTTTRTDGEGKKTTTTRKKIAE